MAIKIAGVDVINDDRELVLAKLTDINETISSTAVDVFIYDTSKDSDGGAWRHRTQHTSWYAEASSASRDVNTRSTRAEFPAVAVIVAEASKVTIYDGDDPSLPMWMVFNAVAVSSSTTDWWRFGRYATCISASNGVVIWGTIDTGCPFVSFAGDFSGRYDSGVQGGLSGNVVEAEGSVVASGTLPSLVNDAINDVAMTVLPDAPTDPATGLPVPTIAVATDGGVSVIKDDGTVVDITYSSYGVTTFVTFSEENELMFLLGASSTAPLYLHVYHAIPSADVANSHGYLAGASDEFYSVETGFTNVYTGLDGIIPFINGTGSAGDLEEITDRAIGNAKGLVAVDRVPSAPASTSFAAITSDYATGWMPGDIKLAALADTTAETLSGSELVTNSGFATDTDWTKGTGWTINTTTGVASFDASVSGAGVQTALTQNITTVAGELYIVKATFSSLVNLSGSELLVSCAGSNLVAWETGSANIITDGTYTFSFIALSSTTEVNIRLTNLVEGDETGSVDNVSVRLADPDRSVNGKGLAVHGSITKAPVATGADVVAYSGFSASNYLEQPYNSDLDFGAYTGTAGTGDFCVMGWLKTVSTSFNSLFHRSLESSNGGFLVQINNTGLLRFFGTASTSYVNILTSSTAVNDGSWKFFSLVRDSGTVSLYLDGEVDVSVSNSTDLTYVDAIATVGRNNAATEVFDGSLALLRISATAPTADQIAKIYEDEKFLFQDSAKATLTGSSDAVTALAYDPDTNLLHVGTSGGRSVFQGLRRVEEHTGTDSQSLAAISAVDGLVVEGK